MVGASYLYPKYKDVVDRESASEMLAARIAHEPPPAKKPRASKAKPEKTAPATK